MYLLLFCGLNFLNFISIVTTRNHDPILIIHGGAGTIPPELQHGKMAMVDCIRAGYRRLWERDDPEAAVVEAIKFMENSPEFNAGTGSVTTATGEIEMDAIIINGTDLTAGAVAGVRHVKNPILLAKLVKDKSPHVFLVGQEAEMFGLNNGVTLVPTRDLLVNSNFTSNPTPFSHHIRKKRSSEGGDVGTVGAVAINSRGQIFAATSTGGMQGKLGGRVGDSAIIGAGTLADDLIGGISATGWGEAFLRYRVASRLADILENNGNMTATQAIQTVLSNMGLRIPEATGGIIAITKDRDIGYAWNTAQMAWAYTKGVDIHYGFNPEEDKIEPLEVQVQDSRSNEDMDMEEDEEKDDTRRRHKSTKRKSKNSKPRRNNKNNNQNQNQSQNQGKRTKSSHRYYK